MKFGIGRKVTLLVVASMAALSLVLWLFFIEQITSALTQELNERANGLLAYVRVNAEYPLLAGDRQQLERLGQAIMAQKDVAFCRIEDGKGRPLFERSIKRGPAAREFEIELFTKPALKNTEELLFGAAESPARHEEFIGKVRLAFSLSGLQDKLRRLRSILAATILLSVALAAWACSAMVRILLSRPIDQLVHATRLISQGRLDYKAQTSTADELGYLAASFNKMTDDLKNTTVSKDYLDDIIHSMTDMLIVLNSDSSIRTINRAAAQLLGYEEKDLVGKPFGLIMADGHFPAGGVVEKDYISRTGEKIAVSFSSALMRSGASSLGGIVCVAQDIRERKRWERIALQTEKLSAVGQLAAGIAHEINNPLGIIVGFAQSLSKRISSSDALALPVKSIEREALRCKNLVQNLLTFSRQSRPRMEPFALNEVIESSLTIAETQARVKSVEVIKELGSIPDVIGDKNQLQQVIINLCTNALDAMPEGGRLTIRTRRAVMAGAPRAVMEVSDTGTGIPPEIRDKIFNPFFTTKEIGKGTGLGLSLVHEIVQRHQGSIELQTGAGRGTTFIVSLPADPAGEPSKRAG